LFRPVMARDRVDGDVGVQLFPLGGPDVAGDAGPEAGFFERIAGS